MHVVLCQEKQEACKNMSSLWSDSVHSISSINDRHLCYHDLNQSKTVMKIKRQKIFHCGQISYDVVIAQLVDFLYFSKRA